jgi:serine/threonine-protein kinase HipA
MGLSIWLYGDNVALVEQEQKQRLRLSYTETALGQYPLGLPLLSLSLPMAARRYPNGVVRAFLDGLLPEGDARNAVAADFNLLASDTYGLIRELGRDCAGALVIQPDEEPRPAQPTTRTAEPLTDGQVADLVSNLRVAPLGVNKRVRISLAGVQEKLLLTRIPDGGWGRPVDGTPSTHILKPSIARYPNTVENEAFCMRFAKNLGLPVAPVETMTAGGRELIVIERYDRIVHPDGTVERIHQEDFCQATGTPPHRKYQEDGGPPLRKIADTLQAAAEPGSLETLLAAVTVNVLIANGDAHAKNFSLLHDPSGALRLAPLYDLMSTVGYGDDHLAMYIDEVKRTDRVTADRIVKEAARWGLSFRRAAEVVSEVLDRVPAAAKAARDETVNVPSHIFDTVGAQLARLRSSFVTRDEDRAGATT